jgi:hypothetical protein
MKIQGFWGFSHNKKQGNTAFQNNFLIIDIFDARRLTAKPGPNHPTL